MSDLDDVDLGDGSDSTIANPLSAATTAATVSTTVGAVGGDSVGEVGNEVDRDAVTWADDPDDDVLSKLSKKRPDDVPAPMQWFQAGLWARLDQPLVIWSFRAALVGAGNTGAIWFLWFVWGIDLNYTTFGVSLLICVQAFTFAFERLRGLVRPQTGALAQLATTMGRDGESDEATITAEAFASLVRWRRGVYGFAGVWCSLLTVTVVADLIKQGPHLGMFVFVWMSAIALVFAGYYLSLRLACALAGEGVAHLASAVSKPATATMSTAEWNTAIRNSAVELAEVTMPALSRWGPPTAAIGGGLGCFGLGFLNWALMSGDKPAFVFSAFLFIAVLAVVMVPASISTDCERMIGALNQLRKNADYRTQVNISQLESFFAGCNREQGIGFMVLGAVINRQQLKVLFAKTWAVLVALYLWLGPLMHPPLPDLSELDTGLGICGSRDWYHADGSCYRIFGDLEEADWKTWPAAQADCERFGSNLASIRSVSQHEATAAIANGLTAVWIGLSDRAEEGNFVWSDGEQLTDFTRWHGKEPGDLEVTSDPWPNDPDIGSSEGCEGGEDCGALFYAGGRHSWGDTNCASKCHYFDSLDDNRNTRWKTAPDNACIEFRLPYICSKPSNPTTMHGGLMHGCKNGGWMVGIAHNNSDLPPTIVRLGWLYSRSRSS
jgi:hypothetical protein